MAMRIQLPCCHVAKNSEQFIRHFSDTGEISSPCRLEASCPECSARIYLEIGVVKPEVPQPPKVTTTVEPKTKKGK